MATFEDGKSVSINKQYQDILQNIPLSAPYDLRRAVDLAAKNLRDFRLELHKREVKLQQEYKVEQENLKKQTEEQHTQLISILNKAKRAVAPYKE